MYGPLKVKHDHILSNYLSKFIVNINLMGQRVKRKLKLCNLSKCQFPSAQGTKSQKLCHLYRDTCIAVQNYASDSCQSSELINSHGGSCVRHGGKTTTNGGYFIFWYFIFWRTHFSTQVSKHIMHNRCSISNYVALIKNRRWRF